MIGIDPGTTQSAIVDIRDDGSIKAHATLPNTELVKQLRFAHDSVAIERIEARGMAVGQDTLDTCFWMGVFSAAARDAHVEVFMVFRRDVKLFLCGTQQAKDANIRQALIDRYGAGSEKNGKKCPKCHGQGFIKRKLPNAKTHTEQIVCPKCESTGWLVLPGKLAGIHEHEWAALAVAVTAQENPKCLVNPDSVGVNS